MKINKNSKREPVWIVDLTTGDTLELDLRTVVFTKKVK